MSALAQSQRSEGRDAETRPGPFAFLKPPLRPGPIAAIFPQKIPSTLSFWADRDGMLAGL